MTDPAQPSAWGTEVPAWEPEVPPWAPQRPDGPAAPGVPRSPASLQEHHEGWTLGEPLPAEPALMPAGETAGGSPAPEAAGDGPADGDGPAAGAGTADRDGPAAGAGTADRDGPAAGAGTADRDGPAAGAGTADRDGGRVGAAARGRDAAAPDSGDRWAMACYLGAIFFWLLAPLVIYLAQGKQSIFIRSHAAQAFNLTLTGTLFAVSGAIIGGLLSLDSPKTGLFIVGPLLLALWIAVLGYLIRAASSASRGDFYELPSWICVPMLQ